jgi:N-acetylmuramoyl-L-alanine amidase
VINEFHERLGYEILCFGRIYHVAYHYLILPNGTVQAGRPERCEGAHARGYNSYVGIALVGNFSKVDNPQAAYGPNVPTAAEMKSLIALCRELRRRYGIPLQRVVRHSDVASTRCPGDGFPIKTLLTALERR